MGYQGRGEVALILLAQGAVQGISTFQTERSFISFGRPAGGGNPARNPRCNQRERNRFRSRLGNVQMKRQGRGKGRSRASRQAARPNVL